jgi:hypothetical protein
MARFGNIQATMRCISASSQSDLGRALQAMRQEKLEFIRQWLYRA